MLKTYTYLLVNFGCIIVPFLFSFHPKLKFARQWKFFLLPCLLTALFFLVWDGWFTSIGIWSFNPDYVLGWSILGLPIEEVLFFICIPYACVFTYHCMTLFFDLKSEIKIAEKSLLMLVVVLVSIALVNITKLYTSITFILLAVFLVLLLYKRVSYLSPFLVSFILILPFFFISNGILTGSFIDAPVVLYNNNHNLNIRLFTIPVEDLFYGMLLLLMNVSGYEYMKSRKKERESISLT